MRPWDNYFWWIELDDLPVKTMVDPENWPPARNVQPALTKASLNANNGMNVTTGAGNITIWLSPEVVTYGQKVSISVNGRKAPRGGIGLDPSLPILLEDARSRADRQHPFWAKVEMPGGKINEMAD